MQDKLYAGLSSQEISTTFETVVCGSSSASAAVFECTPKRSLLWQQTFIAYHQSHDLNVYLCHQSHDLM